MTALQDDLPDAFECDISELPLATPDAADPRVDRFVSDLLRLLREQLDMDVVFIAEFVGGRRVFRRVEAGPDAQVIEEGQSHPLEQTLCQRVIDGRLPALMPDVPALRASQTLPEFPFPIAAYMGVPVRLQDGRIYGTLCCFNFEPGRELGERDLKRLQMSARLAARLIDEAHGRNHALPA